MKICAIITAGGTSSRFGNTNKLLEKINGKEVIKHTVEKFLIDEIAQIIICANKSIIPVLEEFFANNNKIKAYLRLDLVLSEIIFERFFEKFEQRFIIPPPFDDGFLTSLFSSTSLCFSLKKSSK